MPRQVSADPAVVTYSKCGLCEVVTALACAKCHAPLCDLHLWLIFTAPLCGSCADAAASEASS
jgi:hypothetical protein